MRFISIFYNKNVDKSLDFLRKTKKIFDLSTKITLLHIAKGFFIFCFSLFFDKGKEKVTIFIHL